MTEGNSGRRAAIEFAVARAAAENVSLTRFLYADHGGIIRGKAAHASDLEKWVEEAKIVWELDETIGIPRGWVNTPETLEKIEIMRVKAMQKKSLEALRELQA